MRLPVVDDVVVHVADVLVQLVHVYCVGAFVHDAVSVSVLLIAGVVLDATRTHAGVSFGEGGGGGVFGAIQLTATLAFGLVPTLLVARSE